MSFLTPTQKRTLAAICETFVPSLTPQEGDSAELMLASARDLALVDALETGLARVMDEMQQTQLKLFLTAIESGWVNGLTVAKWRGFSALSLGEREAVLRSYALSPIPTARMTFQGLKRLALFLFYTLTPDKPNPIWSAIRYPGGVTPADDAPRPIQPLEIKGRTLLETDVLIIGSGAGGGVIAGELSAAGLDVLIVEKGEYYSEHQFDGRELPATENMFEKYGAFTSSDLSMIILAGSALGGGTTVNWSASLRPPEQVLREWALEYGFTDAAAPVFQQSLDAVSLRMNVGLSEHSINPLNNMLVKGCEALGYDVKPIPRNVKGCEDCGFCNFGCSFGAKQGTLRTYLLDAYQRGARILVRSHVERITHSGGTANGALVYSRDEHGRTHEVNIKARIVVAAGGSLQTPALLLRSGLHNPNVGANLHLHPVTVTYGLFDEPIRGWEGIPMATISSTFADQDGQGYGVRLETAPIHPGVAALTLTWNGGRQHKHLMQQLDHLANIIVITRDRGSGRVVIDRAGRPIVRYRLDDADAHHLRTGMLAALRVHWEAGAREVCGPHSEHRPYRRTPQANGSFEAYLESVRQMPLVPNGFALLSAHQMSSCRIGGSPEIGACDPTGQSYDLRNLYIGDASAMPTASGVNPMLTIMGTAHYIAQQIKARA